MEQATYPVAIVHLQEALGGGNESLIWQAVEQCLQSMEVVAHPILAGSLYLLVGHFFLRRKQYSEARTQYRQACQVYLEAQAARISEADWLLVQASLCEAQAYYRAGKHPQALIVWQQTHRLAVAIPEPSPLSVEVAIRLAEAYRRDGQRRQAVARYEEAIYLAETLPQPLRPLPLLRVLHKQYLPMLDTTPDRRRLQVRIDSLFAEPVIPTAVPTQV